MRQVQKNGPREISALSVHQWLNEWDKVSFDEKEHRRLPDKHFYLFTLLASDLKALTGIQRRTTKGGLLRSLDLGIQRRYDKDRSDEIHEFIKYGYPWSELSESKRGSGEFDTLRKPGWLPTAIVVNILKPGDQRRGRKVSKNNLIEVVDCDERTASIRLPAGFTGSAWKPEPDSLHPIEVIDGQHRLWAFEEKAVQGKFELPVVAFHGLDISWQAYLFWTINIKPKRINASLAFDLYPLLRTEDWLERFEGHSIYRETRAQELTEALWAHQESPWYQRINMLGETRLAEPMVSQAAWIRSLMATYVKAWEGTRLGSWGLFGAKVGSNEEVLPWSRAQQAAFLIVMGQKLRSAIMACKEPWAEELRQGQQVSLFGGKRDPAFEGSHVLLNTDQGIRGILYVTNDLCYVWADKLALMDWGADEAGSAADEKAVSKAIKSLRGRPIEEFLTDIADTLAKYDWRTSSAPGLKEEERTLKAAFRGSGGYKEIRRHLLLHLAREKGDVARAANQTLHALGYK